MRLGFSRLRRRRRQQQQWNWGGGGGNNAPSFSLADLSSIFPALFDYGYVPVYMESNKEYEVSAAKIAAFNASVIQTGGYTYDSTNDWYELPDVLLNTNATVMLNGSIDLYLLGSNFTEIVKDESFESVFGSIDGDITYAYIAKYYDVDISSRFDDYGITLGNNGFNCSASGGDWGCYKIEAGIRYGWATINNNAYAYYAHPL